MRFTLILITASLAALLSLGCDRFEHAFEPPAAVDFASGIFTPLETALGAAPAGGLGPVMAFYAEDYLHFGLRKTDRRAWLEGIFSQTASPLVEVTLQDSQLQTDTTAVANWRLVFRSQDGQTVLADSTFIGERLAKRNGQWLLKGNQMTCLLPNPKQHVIVEYFTFWGCPNCPPLEAKLHELHTQFPEQFSYLEHHFVGPLVAPGDGSYDYYTPVTNFPAPTSIFQGETRISGSGDDIVAEYDNQIQALMQIESPLDYSNFAYSISGNTITGSVQVDVLADEFDTADLYLNYALIDRVSATHNNTAGQPLRNVVRAKGSHAITAAELSSPLAFSLASAVAIPDDASLVLFVQTKPASYAENATIHSGIEVPLSLPARSSR